MAGNTYNVRELKGRVFGRVLLKMGKVTREQVTQAVEVQKQRGGPIGQILVDLGYIDEKTRSLALGFQAGMEYVDLESIQITEDVISQVPAQMATNLKVLPLEYDKLDKRMVVAVASSDNFTASDNLRTLTGFDIVARIADADQLDAALGKYYGLETASMSTMGSIGELINEIVGDEQLAALENRGESIDLDTLRGAAEANPVKRLVNMVLLEAIKNRASDIHFEPFEDEFKMRYRIDGLLYEMLPPPKSIAAAIASRVKVMANLNIAERRIPQDGRIELTINNAPVDLRISVLPTMFGESVVMRVLDRSQVSLDVDRLGMRPDDTRLFRQLIDRPHGIVLVTGPTGSGKTTTLYSALNELNDVSVKILTAEEPVEYDIDGLVQVNVKEDIGLTFARALRSFLRQDPDIVLVGEIRDLETAEISIQASLTGHLVFSTLHTNDAPSSIARLLDLGVEPFLITATLEGIVAQRLVRKVCSRCKEAFSPTEEQLMELNLTPDDVVGKTFYRGRRCEACRNTGYSGRAGLFEIMLLDDNMRDLIMKRSSTNVLREASRKKGMRTLRESGLLAIYDGLTTIEEVVSQTIYEEGDE
ncbi:MAG: ATPase, T2SS/T4P/T4SS family [Phycisphaerae bacterium]|jgi:type IV pilus assembly protein PilB